MAENASIQTQPALANGFVESCSRSGANNALHINNIFYSYDELYEKAAIVFERLNQKNFPQFIGVYGEESVWTYASIIAISLSGACYVPLNPKLPKKKLLSIIRSSGLRLVISQHAVSFIHASDALIIDTKSSARKKPEQLMVQKYAYLLFTSGSTGEPKGVPVSKKNANAFLSYYKKNFDFNDTDRFLQPYELSFDVSVFCIFSAWNAGACVYVVPETGFKHFNIAAVMKDHNITISSMVPTVLQYLEKYLDAFSFPALRYSFFSGDKLYQHLAVKWGNSIPNAQIFNCYGPTETTIVCTSYEWKKDISDKESVNNIVSIGKPFEGMDYILIDENNVKITEGIGELCFTGPQVIDTYLSGMNETAFFIYSGKRYYKTGDQAGVNENGNLIFYGRLDTQVKINGYRIELAEIESVFLKLLERNVIVLPGSRNNVMELFVFIEGVQLDEAALKLKLAEFLPQYMIPAHYRFMESFPKNINDKIDRQQLQTFM